MMTSNIDLGDYESRLFLTLFNNEAPCLCLEVGAHDAPLATALCERGFTVVSTDLRDYDGPAHPHHHHVTGDFVRTFADNPDWRGRFDVVYSVSALEHFGLGTYGEAPRPYLDVVAARYMYDALKPGGRCYVVVPFGAEHVDYGKHWRVYSTVSFDDRIRQDMDSEIMCLYLSQPIMSREGVVTPAGTPVDTMMLESNRHGFPGITLLAKMVKRASA